jgi:hypothetical protein
MASPGGVVHHEVGVAHLAVGHRGEGVAAVGRHRDGDAPRARGREIRARRAADGLEAAARDAVAELVHPALDLRALAASADGHRAGAPHHAGDLGEPRPVGDEGRDRVGAVALVGVEHVVDAPRRRGADLHGGVRVGLDVLDEERAGRVEEVRVEVAQARRAEGHEGEAAVLGDVHRGGDRRLVGDEAVRHEAREPHLRAARLLLHLPDARDQRLGGLPPRGRLRGGGRGRRARAAGLPGGARGEQGEGGEARRHTHGGGSDVPARAPGGQRRARGCARTTERSAAGPFRSGAAARRLPPRNGDPP